MTLLDGPPRKPRTLTREQRVRAEEHLDRFVGDPLYMDYRDEDFIQHTTRQFGKVYGNAPHVPGNIHPEPGDGVIGNDIEGYRPPSLFVDELELSGSVGEGGRNRGKDVIAAKKVLSRLGAFDFDLMDGKSTEVTSRFLDSLRTAQQALGEKPDGRADPRGPTITALRDAVFDSAGFERDTPDRDLAPKLAKAKRELAERAEAAAEKAKQTGEDAGEDATAETASVRKPEVERPMMRPKRHNKEQEKNSAADFTKGGEGLLFSKSDQDERRRLVQEELERAKSSRRDTTPILKYWENRRWSILNERPARFEIASNPNADSSEPWMHYMTKELLPFASTID